MRRFDPVPPTEPLPRNDGPSEPQIPEDVVPPILPEIPVIEVEDKTADAADDALGELDDLLPF